ncbi:hypothetical protein AB8O64_24310 [Streptomyces sp. QH1-20]|uniref:hypothetical protein n=1 Tax=Streptomyces sp. QH1-20 TaxID=3240934 RepID=UPI0035145F39
MELALGKPTGLAPNLAGPQVYATGELSWGYLRASGERRLLMPVRVGRAYRAGENLSLVRTVVGVRTWESFLAERVECEDEVFSVALENL